MAFEDMDMTAAVSEIGSGLGFDVDENKIIEGEGHVVDDSGDLDGDNAGAASDVDGAGGAKSPSTDEAADGTGGAAAEEGAQGAAPVAPRTWRPEAAAEFAKLPPVVQSEILKREEDIFKGIEGYKEAAAFGNSLKTVLDPYLPTLQQYGIRPEAQVADMMQAHYTLAFGTPEQKIALVHQVLKDYNIPFAPQAAVDTPVWVDPQVEALQKELQGIKSTLSKSENAQIERQKAEITQHVQSFASDPKNVYFEELANDIAHLLRTGAEKSVESAYEAAIWRNPVTRAKEFDRQQAERTEAARKAEQERVRKAKEATEINVRSKAKTRGAATPVGSIDDTLNETLASINARSN